MPQLLKVYQVFYEENQREKLIYEPFYNPKCTIYFENEVIKTLALEGKHLDAEYFGVVSHNLIEKLPGVVYKNKSANKFHQGHFERNIYIEKPDIAGFQTLDPHDSITEADKFHPNFSKLFKKVVENIGYKWTPEIYYYVFYSNNFVAKSEVYEDYVTKMLIPAMEVMQNMPEAWEDSRYYKNKTTSPEKLKQIFSGRPYYTMHTFVCERLFSFYVHLNKKKLTIYEF